MYIYSIYCIYCIYRHYTAIIEAVRMLSVHALVFLSRALAAQRGVNAAQRGANGAVK